MQGLLFAPWTMVPGEIQIFPFLIKDLEIIVSRLGLKYFQTCLRINQSTARSDHPLSGLCKQKGIMVWVKYLLAGGQEVRSRGGREIRQLGRLFRKVEMPYFWEL